MAEVIASVIPLKIEATSTARTGPCEGRRGWRLSRPADGQRPVERDGAELVRSRDSNHVASAGDELPVACRPFQRDRLLPRLETLIYDGANEDAFARLDRHPHTSRTRLRPPDRDTPACRREEESTWHDAEEAKRRVDGEATRCGRAQALVVGRGDGERPAALGRRKRLGRNGSGGGWPSGGGGGGGGRGGNATSYVAGSRPPDSCHAIVPSGAVSVAVTVEGRTILNESGCVLGDAVSVRGDHRLERRWRIHAVVLKHESCRDRAFPAHRTVS